MERVCSASPTAVEVNRMTESRGMALACFSVDVEQDCPPYLDTCRGMTEGMPRLLDLLAELHLRGTFFTTGEMARRFPLIIERLVAAGHELASHGDRHLDFATLSRAEAAKDLGDSVATLRQFGPVISFRAPYLRFPAAFLPLLSDHGLAVDSSLARYKFGPDHCARPTVNAVARVPASLTSSVLRLPAVIRSIWIASAKNPAVLFVHPWEAADFRASKLRWDCRFRTGEIAIRLWREVLSGMLARGAQFQTIRELAGHGIAPVSARDTLSIG